MEPIINILKRGNSEQLDSFISNGGILPNDSICYAVSNGNIEIVKYLYEVVNVPYCDNLISYASNYGNLEVVRFLYENYDICDYDLEIAMSFAVKYDFMEIVQFLNDNGVKFSKQALVNARKRPAMNEFIRSIKSPSEPKAYFHSKKARRV